MVRCNLKSGASSSVFGVLSLVRFGFRGSKVLGFGVQGLGFGVLSLRIGV
jgi:hypothetical protein